MTMNSNKKVNKTEISREDAALYRLFAIIAFAIAGFAGLIAIGENEGRLWNVLSSVWFKVIMLVLLAASIAAFVLERIGKLKLDLKIFTVGGLCEFFAPLFLMFASYSEMTSANTKCKIALVAVIFIAFIANVYPKSYAIFSTVAAFSAMFMYYLGKDFGLFSGKLLDMIIKVAAYPMAFIIPAGIAAALFIAKKNKGKFKIGRRTLFRISDKTVFASLITVLGAAILLSALVLIVPSLLIIAEITFGALFIAVGIICTIKIL